MDNTNIKGTESNPLSATEEDLKTPGLVGLLGMTHDSWHQQMIHELEGKNRNEEAGRQREFLFSHCRELSIHLKGNQWICEHGRFHFNLQFSAGPKEPCPNLAISSSLFLTVAQAFHGKRDRGLIPKMYQEKYCDISEGQSMPTPNRPSICPPSI